MLALQEKPLISNVAHEVLAIATGRFGSTALVGE